MPGEKEEARVACHTDRIADFVPRQHAGSGCHAAGSRPAFPERLHARSPRLVASVSVQDLTAGGVEGGSLILLAVALTLPAVVPSWFGLAASSQPLPTFQTKRAPPPPRPDSRSTVVVGHDFDFCCELRPSKPQTVLLL
jgi:hypothetical protein